MIDIRNLSVDHGRTPILHDISLSIPKGGIVGIIGPNGAGKSTLLHTIAGLVAPKAGSVTIEGTDVHRVNEGTRALLLSLLTQSQGAVPRLTVHDLLSFGRWPHHRGRPGPEDRTAIDKALDLFDLAPLRERDIDTLSGGQKQRAYIAMAYAQSTPWILLDEPLAALDPKFARDIMGRLHAITTDPDDPRTVILVLHDLSAAVRYADWCICLKGGELVKAGPRDVTLTTENLSGLFEIPLQVREVEGTPIVVA